MKAISGVYAITNTVNGKRYVGSAVNMRCRWASHRRELRANKHGNKYLQNAWNKYGEAAFDFTIVELVLPAFLLDIEQKHLDANRGGYNLARYAAAPGKGRVRGVEERARLSAAHKGRSKSLEARAKMRAAKLGRRLTPEWKAKIGAAGKGRRVTEETRARMSNAQKGKYVSPETREKLRVAKQKHPSSKPCVICGTVFMPPPSKRARAKACSPRCVHELLKIRWVARRATLRITPELREKLSAAGLGRHPSLESRLKMSKTHKARAANPEVRTKLAAANKMRWDRVRLARAQKEAPCTEASP
jgi:group I intron endonuclease